MKIQRRWNDGELFGQCTTLRDMNSVSEEYVMSDLFQYIFVKTAEMFLAVGHVYCQNK
jgi:hypothetical protein